MNIEININKVNEEKDKLNELSKRIKEIADESIDKTKLLKDYWQSKTSERYYNEFEKYKEDINKYLEDCNDIISYLQDIVTNGYKEYDKNVNKTIDENLTSL